MLTQPLLDELATSGYSHCSPKHSRRGRVYVEAADAGLYTSEYESFGLSILETVCSTENLSSLSASVAFPKS